MRAPWVCLALGVSSLMACGPVPMNGDATSDGAAGDAIAPMDGGGSGEDAAVVDAAPRTWDVAPLPPGMAITATNESWTWVPFPDSHCGNGSPAGIGVNLTNRSNRVFVYMMGGGACWDDSTCYGLGTATNINVDYTEAQFNRDLSSYRRLAAFDRTDMTNPFRDANFVFIPYCTGDVHGGDKVNVYDESMPERRTYHHGTRNVSLFLQRLMPTFATADRIWLTGSSAGGVGAMLNWPKFIAAFPSARVDVLDDGGQLCDANNGRARDWRRAWALPVPPDCPECATSLAANVVWMHRTYAAGRRSGLLATLQDSTLRGFYTTNATNFETATRALLTQAYDPNPTTKYFVLPGSMHTFWGGYSTIAAADGTRLRDWITAWATDDASWSNVGP